MAESEKDKRFWQAVEEIKKKSPADRKSHWLLISENYKGGKHLLEVVQLMAVILGGQDGELWFREAFPSLPFPQRSCEKSRATSRNFTNKIEGL